MAEAFDYRSESQKKRAALHDKIARSFVTYRSQAGENTSDNKIFTRIAIENHITLITVRSVCIKAGVAKPKKS